MDRGGGNPIAASNPDANMVSGYHSGRNMMSAHHGMMSGRSGPGSTTGGRAPSLSGRGNDSIPGRHPTSSATRSMPRQNTNSNGFSILSLSTL